VSCGKGAKGHRLYDWAFVRLDHNGSGPDGQAGKRWLMVRRNHTTGELAFYRCFTPRPVPLAVLVHVAGRRVRPGARPAPPVHPGIAAPDRDRGGPGAGGGPPVNLLGGIAWWAAIRMARQGRPTKTLVTLYDRLMIPAERAIERHIQPWFGQSILCVARVPEATGA
jgi:hypothetical protein